MEYGYLNITASRLEWLGISEAEQELNRYSITPY